MIGLMIKDVYTMKKQSKMTLLISLFYIIFSIADKNIGFLSFVVMFANLGILLSTFSYDEKSHWEKYSRILPVSYQKIVFSRYAEILIINAAVFAIIMPISFFIRNPDLEILEVLSIIVAVICVSIILLSIIFPIIFKLGMEKARVMIFIIIFIPICATVTLGKLDIGLNMAEFLDSPIVNYISYHLYIICPLIAAVFFILSYQISKSVVAKKEY